TFNCRSTTRSSCVSSTACKPFSLATDSLSRLIPWADSRLLILFFSEVFSFTMVSRVRVRLAICARVLSFIAARSSGAECAIYGLWNGPCPIRCGKRRAGVQRHSVTAEHNRYDCGREAFVSQDLCPPCGIPESGHRGLLATASRRVRRYQDEQAVILAEVS